MLCFLSTLYLKDKPIQMLDQPVLLDPHPIRQLHNISIEPAFIDCDWVSCFLFTPHPPHSPCPCVGLKVHSLWPAHPGLARGCVLYASGCGSNPPEHSAAPTCARLSERQSWPRLISRSSEAERGRDRAPISCGSQL